MTDEDEPFWQTKSLDEMSREEWESLCDGCGRCCLVKLEDDQTGEVHYTDVACRLLDPDTCRCQAYAAREVLVPDCLRITPALVGEAGWLPPTCAYRVVAEGGDLAWWHPLVSGTTETVHQAGISVLGRISAECDIADEDLEGHMVTWPLSRCE